MKSRYIALFVLSLASFLLVPQAVAQQSRDRIYRLYNHPEARFTRPDGSPGAAYGARADGYLEHSSFTEVFAFDFDAPESKVKLYHHYDNNVEIIGVMMGGRVVDGEFVHDEHYRRYDVEMMYEVETTTDDDDLIVRRPYLRIPNGEFRGSNGENPQSIGESGDSGDGLEFRFGDEDNDKGHQGHEGFAGWGEFGINVIRGEAGVREWLFAAVPIESSYKFLEVKLGDKFVAEGSAQALGDVAKGDQKTLAVAFWNENNQRVEISSVEFVGDDQQIFSTDFPGSLITESGYEGMFNITAAPVSSDPVNVKLRLNGTPLTKPFELSLYVNGPIPEPEPYVPDPNPLPPEEVTDPDRYVDHGDFIFDYSSPDALSIVFDALTPTCGSGAAVGIVPAMLMLVGHRMRRRRK